MHFTLKVFNFFVSGDISFLIIIFQFKANEELANIYPNFVSFPGNGNALERVLALEIELAEALRTKKKSTIQFQRYI